MAGKYTKQQLKDMLQRSTFQVVMENGIEGMTVRKVSRGCGLSDPFVYQCYSDLRELMVDAFLKVDKEVADLVSEVIVSKVSAGVQDIEELCWLIWSTYWQFLMNDPEKIVFYWRFYQSAYYNHEVLEERLKYFQIFTTFVLTAGQNTHLDQVGNVNAIVSNIIDSTVSLVVKIHLGQMKVEDIPVQDVYGSIFSYLLHLLGIDIWSVLRQRKGLTGDITK